MNPRVAPSAQPRGCTNFKLRQLTRLVTRHYETFFASRGLRITQYTLLSHVVRLGSVPSSELADAMQLTPSTLTRNLQALIQQGLVQLQAGQDARHRFVQATALGARLQAELQMVWKQAQLALNERLGTQQVLALHSLLDNSISAMDLHGDASPNGEHDEP